jgi:hypothetical protein
VKNAFKMGIVLIVEKESPKICPILKILNSYSEPSEPQILD